MLSTCLVTIMTEYPPLLISLTKSQRSFWPIHTGWILKPVFSGLKAFTRVQASASETEM